MRVLHDVRSLVVLKIVHTSFLDLVETDNFYVRYNVKSGCRKNVSLLETCSNLYGKVSQDFGV